MMAEEKQHRAPTVINVDEHVYSVVVDEIERLNWLRLGKNSTPRGNLLLFAMALGWHNGLRVEIKKAHSGGFARRESFSPEIPVIVNAAHFGELEYQNIDDLRYLDDAYSICEQYANGGFNIIEGELSNGTTTEEFAAELIAEMDKLYGKWFSE